MSKTLMRHPDKPEQGIISIPLNEWARYRRGGWEFCNEAIAETAPPVTEVPAGGEPPAEVATEEEPSEEAEEPAKGRRRTAAKEEE